MTSRSHSSPDLQRPVSVSFSSVLTEGAYAYSGDLSGLTRSRRGRSLSVLAGGALVVGTVDLASQSVKASDSSSHELLVSVFMVTAGAMVSFFGGVLYKFSPNIGESGGRA